jgi:hypothetical protein
MTGHIRRRGKESWELKFDLGADPMTSKRRVRYASFKGTKREAAIELARLVTQNVAGEGIDPSKATFSDLHQTMGSRLGQREREPENAGAVSPDPQGQHHPAYRYDAHTEATPGPPERALRQVASR